MSDKIYPLICTRGVIIFPNQEIVIDVGREASLKAIENAQDNYDDQIVLFSQKKMDQENPQEDDIYHVGTLCEIPRIIPRTPEKVDRWIPIRNGARRIITKCKGR